MKELKILIGVPTAGTVCIAFANSVAAMTNYFSANGCRTIPEAKITLGMGVLESSNWITNREKLGRRAIDEGMTHLMFLDDDMDFEANVLDVLIGRRQPVVTCNYLIKTMPPRDFVAVGLDGNRLTTKESSIGIQPVLYSGFGVSLISTDVLRAVPQPWFQCDFNAATNEYTTEDNPFFRKVREAGFEVFVDHDASKLVGHWGRHRWSWKDVDHTVRQPVQLREVANG